MKKGWAYFEEFNLVGRGICVFNLGPEIKAQIC